MAKFFIDASHSTEKDAMVKQDGSTLTLTGSARILYDDVAQKRTLMVAIDRMIEKANETFTQGAGTSSAIVGAAKISSMLAAMKSADASRASIGWHGMSIIAGVGADGTNSTVRNARWQDASLPAKVSQALNTARGGAFGPGVETLSSPNSLNTYFVLGGSATLTAEYALVAGVAGQGVSLVGGTSNNIQFTVTSTAPSQKVRCYGICTQASSGVTPRVTLTGANTLTNISLTPSTADRPVPGASAWFYTVDLTLTNAGTTVITLQAPAAAAPTAGGGNVVYYAINPNYLGASAGLTIHRLAQSTRALGMTVAGSIDSSDTVYPNANWCGSAQADWRNGQTDSITTALGLQGVICTFDINEVNTVSGGGVHGFGWTLADHTRHMNNYLAAMNSRGLQVLLVLGPFRNPSTVVQTTYNQLDLINAYKACADASPNAAYIDLVRNFAPGGTAQQKYDAQVADTSGWLAAEAPNYVHPGPGAITAFANDVATAIQAAW